MNRATQYVGTVVFLAALLCACETAGVTPTASPPPNVFQDTTASSIA